MRIEKKLFALLFVLFIFRCEGLVAQDFLSGEDDGRDSLVLKYQQRLSKLIFLDKKKAIHFIDSMQEIWPLKYESPLSLKDKFLIETYLQRPDSAINWFLIPDKLNKIGNDLGCDSGRISDSLCPNLLREALSKNSFGSFIRDKKDDFVFTEFLRNLVYFKTVGKVSSRGFGAYQVVNAQIFLEENPKTKYRSFVENIAKQSLLPAKYRFGFDLNYRPMVRVLNNKVEYSPNFQVFSADLWFGINRWTFSGGFQWGIVTVQRKYQEKKWSDKIYDLRENFFLGRAQLTYKIKTFGIVSSSLIAGLGYGEFNEKDRSFFGIRLETKPKHGQVWDVSFGFKIGFGRGWLFSDQANEAGKSIMWSEFYILPQAGYLKIAEDVDSRYASLSFGVLFGWSKSTNKVSQAARNWYKLKELSTRREKLFPGPKRFGSVF